MIIRHALTCLITFILFVKAAAEIAGGQVIAATSVVYSKDKEGNKLTGLLYLVMTEGKSVQILGKPYHQGKFSLHLEKSGAEEITTALDPLCIPLTAGGDLIFRQGTWPVVTHDFNKDGISEFNLGQRGNSWGDHFMLFTFAQDGSGKVEAMTVSEEMEDNYLHPEDGGPSTHYLLETKEGFKHTFTERGDPVSREVYIHYRWNAKANKFEESKRVAID
ncbi:MAG: hypothetical protein H7A51_11610 [Akkermansiaceae bacterium]|nr:hypothetical protein [Akkermansiaceae bacterium]